MKILKLILIELAVAVMLCTCASKNAIAADNRTTLDIAFFEEPVRIMNMMIKEAKDYYNNKIDEIEQTIEEESVEESEEYYWDGEVLNAFSGVANGPSGKETYYNLPMGGVIDNMRGLGYDEESYPYWVRDDGVKMLGSYVMCAACLDIRPYGTVLPSSVGMAIVCDTGGFALNDQYQLDIAVDW